jgi:hypothetical protein
VCYVVIVVIDCLKPKKNIRFVVCFVFFFMDTTAEHIIVHEEYSGGL